VAISDESLHRLRDDIAIDKADRYYERAEWKSVAAQVKRMDNYECQHCKMKGKYRRGVLVHHVKHLKDYPELALSIYDPVTGARQLVTLCRLCHEDIHPEHQRQWVSTKDLVTCERWD